MFSKLWKLWSFLLFILRKPLFHRPAEKTAFVEMAGIRGNRRLFQVCRLLTENGYRCLVRMPFSRFVKLDAYGRAICLDPAVARASGRERSLADLVVSDAGPVDEGEKSLRIRYEVFGQDVDPVSSLFYPILLHPDIHDRSQERKGAALFHSLSVEDGARMGVFFAGNCSFPKYDDEETRRYFGIDTRWAIFERIKSDLPSERLFLPKSYAELVEGIEGGSSRRKVVLVNTNDFEIPAEDWLGILSKADFFIHMPGYIQPFCHNHIESLSVGAIPITQFPKLYRPAFEPGVNCLAFRGLEELGGVLGRVLDGTCSRADVRVMRENAFGYYDEHLSFDSFARALSGFMADDGERLRDLYICAGDRSMTERQ